MECVRPLCLTEPLSVSFAVFFQPTLDFVSAKCKVLLASEGEGQDAASLSFDIHSHRVKEHPSSPCFL